MSKRIIRVDPSSLESWPCLRKFQFVNRMGLVSKIRDDALEFGQALHRGVAEWMRDRALGKQRANTNEYIQIAEAYYKSRLCPHAPPRDPDNLVMALQDYFDRYAKDPFQPLCTSTGSVAVELPFEYPILETEHTTVMLTGVVDSIGHSLPNRVFAMKDLKHSSTTNMEAHLNAQRERMQFKIYSAAIRHHGFCSYYPPVIVDAIYISKKFRGARLYRTDPFVIEDHQVERAMKFVRYVAERLVDLPDNEVWPHVFGTQMCEGRYNKQCEFVPICMSKDEDQQHAIDVMFARREYNPATFGE